MKYIIAIFIFSITITGQSYQLDIHKSQLKWTGKAAFSSYSLSGTLKAKSGNITISNNQITATTIIIDMKSLSSEMKDLTKHLRGKDFFEVKKYPKATFELSEPIDLNDKNPKAIGQLTIKNQTKDYSFPLMISQEEISYQVKGTITINRTEFGIYYNSPNYFEGLKQQAIADQFELELNLRFEK